MNNDRTNSTGKDRLIVNIILYPTHQVLNICWRGHLSWPLEILRILPEILKPMLCEYTTRGHLRLHTHPLPSFLDTIVESRIR